jgi:hypothetical protein
MKQTLTDIQVEYDEPIPIYCDNTSAISISKNSVMHSKTKNIPIKYHFLQEHVVEKNIRVEYVGTKKQVANIFTKPFPRESFEYLHQRLEVIYTPKLMILNSYLICLRHTRGITIKRIVQSGGATPDGKIPFPLMTKGEIFIRCRGHMHGFKKSNGHKDAEDRGMVPGGA